MRICSSVRCGYTFCITPRSGRCTMHDSCRNSLRRLRESRYRPQVVDAGRRRQLRIWLGRSTSRS